MIIITTRITLLLLALLAGGSCSEGLSGRRRQVAVRGVADLRKWDFDRDGPAHLSGEWVFHWNRLDRGHDLNSRGTPDEFIEVPGIWNGRSVSGQGISGDGCATYLLEVLLPGGTGKRKLAIKVQDMGTAYSLFLNEVLAASGGVVGETAEKGSPGYWPDVVEAVPEGGRMTIAIQVSNYHHRKGGVWEPVLLGPLDTLRDMRERNLARDFFLFGAIVLMGAYHLVLFSLRKKDRSHLLFGVFCLLIGVRVLVTGEYFALRILPMVTWEGIVSAEYLSFYAGVPFFFLFLRNLFPDDFSPKVAAGTVAAGALFCCAVIGMPSRIYTHTMRPYQVLSAAICLYGLFVLVRAVARRRDGAVPFIAGFIIMFVTVINDFLHNNMIIQTGYLVPCGLLLFIMLQAYLLSQRFSRTFAAVEDLTGELELKNRRLMEMDTLKDEFLATVSHELRTPLNGIIGIAESMVSGQCGMLSLESKFNLGLINASGRRLAALVNDILDFSRLKNSDIILKRGPVDMKALADVVLAFVRPLVGARSLALINSIPPGCPLAGADEDRVQQILYNLVGNAVKFTSSGSIVVSACARGEEWLEVSVSDTGIGVRQDELDGIFSNREMYGSLRSGDREGAGIGLSITRKLVELHGGTIRAEAAPGSGAIFTFTLPVWSGIGDSRLALPVAEGHETVLPATGTVPPVVQSAGDELNGKGRILVVDDDMVNLQVMRNHLLSEGFTVDTEPGGAGALDRMGHESYDLVILDLMMPGMSGLELCGEVRKRFSLIELPVIFLTARHGIHDLVAGFRIGANDYLYKPVRRDELLARVRTLVDLKRTVRDRDDARYKLLQERMNPHFLFNSLNTVHALINRDRALADRAVIMLADNYRFLIDCSFCSLIPFDTEWQFVENYLKLEELRFNDSLSASMERQGDFSFVRVPPLTLQPLVENALKHGIRQKRGRGKIRIFAETAGGMVRISVADNGSGPASVDLFSRSLGNIRNRLSHYFRDVELTVEKGEVGGAMVRLSFFSENNATFN